MCQKRKRLTKNGKCFSSGFVQRHLFGGSDQVRGWGSCRCSAHFRFDAEAVSPENDAHRQAKQGDQNDAYQKMIDRFSGNGRYK